MTALEVALGSVAIVLLVLNVLGFSNGKSPTGRKIEALLLIFCASYFLAILLGAK